MTSTNADTLTRSTDSSQPLVPLLEERWSPRSYDASAAIADETRATPGV